MTPELAINFLICTNLASAALGFYSWRKWGKWKGRAATFKSEAEWAWKNSQGWLEQSKFEQDQRLQAEVERDALQATNKALLADAAERSRKLSEAGKKGRQVQLEKRRAA